MSGWDSTNVFLSNLPCYTGANKKANITTAKAEVHNLLQQYGSISSVSVNPEKGTAFVTFVKRDDAQVAIYRLDNTTLSGDKIRVSWAKSGEERRPFNRDNRNNDRNDEKNGENGDKSRGQRAPRRIRAPKKEKKSGEQNTEEKEHSNELQKKAEVADKPRFSQFQAVIAADQKKPAPEEKLKPYIAPAVRPATVVSTKFEVHIKSKTSNTSTTVTINEEEYLKYIMPLIKRHLK